MVANQNINTERPDDERVEYQLSLFLDRNFYSAPIFWDAARTTDKEHQVAGSDIVITVPALRILEGIVDEKAAISFTNRELNTYALEVSMIDRGGNETLGWLMSPRSRTEYYLFQWIRANVNSWKDIREDNITEVEVLLVRKRSIIEWLRTNGLSYKRILDINRSIRGGMGAEYLVKRGREWKFSYSARLPERPVNIVIDKKVYEGMALIHEHIRPGIIPESLKRGWLWK